MGFCLTLDVLPTRRSFGAILEANRGHGPGFDFMRLALALCVVLFHAFQLSYGRDWNEGLFVGPIMLIVPAFFALSGFLVTGSMVRNPDVKGFLVLRGLRILPALGVEITLSALILGPIVTSVPLAEYVADPRFVRYFTNAIGVIRFALPGVFETNPVAMTVNGQLWTVPSELHCYMALALAMLLRISAQRWAMLALFLVAASAECFLALLPGRHYTLQVLNSPEMLVLCFVCGNVFYLWKDRIPADIRLFAASIVAYMACVFLVPALGLLVGSLAASYFTVYLGMQRIPRVPVLMAGDYSYGIYLYSFPIQQTVVWLLPDERQWFVNLAISAPLAILFAAASWHYVEKPCLRLRRRLTTPFVRASA